MKHVQETNANKAKTEEKEKMGDKKPKKDNKKKPVPKKHQR